MLRRCGLRIPLRGVRGWGANDPGHDMGNGVGAGGLRSLPVGAVQALWWAWGSDSD